MATLNLLPQELAFKSKDKVLIVGIKKILISGFVLLIVASLLLTGYLIFMSLKIRSSISNEETLKAEVGSLSQTEQSFYLIKDRISKIKTVLAKESVNEQIKTISDFLGENTKDVRILEIQIASQKVEISLVFPTSTSFGLFYKSLIESNSYRNIILKTFSFNPSLGYLASFELMKK